MNSLGWDKLKTDQTISKASTRAQGRVGRHASHFPNQRGVGANDTCDGSWAYSSAGLCPARISRLLGDTQTTGRNTSPRFVPEASLSCSPPVSKEKPCQPTIEPRSFIAEARLSARKNPHAAATARNVATRPTQSPAPEWLTGIDRKSVV